MEPETPSPGPAVPASIWRVPHWPAYWLARLSSNAGSAVTLVILPVLVYRMSGSEFLSGLVAGIGAIPYLVFGMFAGVIADRVDRRRLMVATDVANALVLASVPLASVLGILTVPHLVVVAATSASLFVWFDAANFGALPTLVGRTRLIDAHSILQATHGLAAIAGPLVAGFLITVVGAAPAMTIDAASYLLSAGLLLLIPRHVLTTPRAAGPQAASAAPMRSDIREGLSFVRQHPVVRSLTAFGALLSITAGGMLGILVVFATQGLGLATDDGRIGLLYASVAAGGLVAAAVVPQLARRMDQGLITIGGLTATSLLSLGLVMVDRLELAMPMLVAWAASYMSVTMNGVALRQRQTPDRLQSRVNVTGRMLTWGTAPLGAMAAGALAELFGVRVAYLVLVLPVLLAAVASWRSPLRRPTDPAPPPDLQVATS